MSTGPQEQNWERKKPNHIRISFERISSILCRVPRLCYSARQFNRSSVLLLLLLMPLLLRCGSLFIVSFFPIFVALLYGPNYICGGSDCMHTKNNPNGMQFASLIKKISMEKIKNRYFFIFISPLFYVSHLFSRAHGEPLACVVRRA